MNTIDITSKKINLREFANLELDGVLFFCSDRREIIVVDDDGREEITDTFLLNLTWFGLIVHREFNNEKYSIDEVITLSGKNGYPTYIDDDLINKPLIEFIDILFVKYNDPAVYDTIKQLIFVHQNIVHNFLTIITEPSVVSIRATDILPVFNFPAIISIRERRRALKITTGEAIKEFNEIMLHESSFDKMDLVMLYRTKGLDKIQSYQLLIERGSVFDLDGEVLSFNIYDNYADGISNIADSIADSKGGGYSLLTNGKALSNSEWFHSKIHRLCSVIMGVKWGEDCGTQKGAKVYVASKDVLRMLDGSYYIKENGELSLIYRKTYDDIKIGSSITIRSIGFCRHLNSGYPCATCYGKMITSLPYNPYTKRSAVPGLFFSSILGEKIGQTMLKMKHRIGDTSVAKYIVDPIGEDFIRTDNTYIYFKEDFIREDKSPCIIVDKATFKEINEFHSIESMEDIECSQLPTHDSITLSVKLADSPMSLTTGSFSRPSIRTSVGGRKGRMTKEFIVFLKGKSFEKENKGKNKGKLKFPLDGWDYEIPAFELPNINENLDEYRKRVEEFINFGHLGDKIKEPVTEEFYGEQFLKYWDVISEQFSEVNKIIIDIILASTLTRDPDNLDYSLPHDDIPRYFVKYSDAFMNRGQGCAILHGYQAQQTEGVPAKFIMKNRQRNALECYLHPLTKE